VLPPHKLSPLGLSYPRGGVVCDSVGRVCYDSYGPSIGITNEVYGQKAANQLMRGLTTSTSRDFQPQYRPGLQREPPYLLE